MSAERNTQLMQTMFTEFAWGEHQTFLDQTSEELVWEIAGITPWSRTYRGKAEVLAELMRPIRAQFAEPQILTAERFIAEGDHVVVTFRGRVTTKEGRPYHGTYCWICRIEDGMLKHVVEYLDTALFNSVIAPPAQN